MAVKNRATCYCVSGHTFVVALDEQGEPSRTQISCLYPIQRRTDDYAIERGITVAGTFWLLCPECQYEAKVVRRFRGIITRSLCDTICAQASGGDCRCQCGGMNHGVIA